MTKITRLMQYIKHPVSGNQASRFITEPTKISKKIYNLYNNFKKSSSVSCH
jgi:hypothetical protein